MNGSVKTFNSAGYGYITGEDGHDYYVHYTSVVTRPQDLKAGQKVSFQQDLTKKQAEAVEVKVLG